jgi:hypothetical protein
VPGANGSDVGEAGFDRQVDKDWWKFKRELAAWLCDAAAPSCLRIELLGGAGGSGRHARLLVEDDGAWLVLSLGSRPAEETHRALVDAGYRPVVASGNARSRRELPGEYVDHVGHCTHARASELAVRLMKVLRELGALHPAMLAVRASAGAAPVPRRERSE